MSAETAPSTTQTLTPEQRIQREQMLMNGIGGDDSNERIDAVMSYNTNAEATETIAPTVAEESAAELLAEFEAVPSVPEDGVDFIALAAETQRANAEKADPQKELARVAAHQALNMMASEAAGRNGRELDEADLQARRDAIDRQYS